MFGTMRGWVDERVDQSKGRPLPLVILRLGAATVIAVLTALTLGPKSGVIWAACAASAELATSLTKADAQSGERRSLNQRLAYLAAVLWMNSVWSALGVMLWATGTPAGLLAAICMVATQMLHAMTFANRSPGLLLAIAGPPAAVLAWLTWIGVGVDLQSRLMAIGGAGIMVAYLTMAAKLSGSQAQAAETGKADAIAASETKSAYLAFMSHELRTPLTGVLGMAEALQARPDGADRDAQLEVLIRSSRGMLSMLNDLLDIAKIEAGRLELERTAVDVRSEIESIAMLWAEAARAKSVAVVCDLDASAEVTVASDSTRLRQILNNLVGNAVKFTSQGAVTLSARMVQRQGAAHLQLSVSDTGAGMPPEVSGRLFQPFTQADASVARRFGGTGLGLSICRQLAEQMGGEIAVESVLGQGSVFRVTLPVEFCSPVAGVRVEPPPVAPEGLRVLFVDDNPANRQVGLALLSAVGWDVMLAEDGLMAVEMARSQAPDIILMDLNMPRMDGFEALAALRKSSSTAHIPVVAISADVSAAAERSTAQAGFAALASKPIELQTLLATLGEVLGAADREQGLELERAAHG